jgi:hypothetical protein
MSKFEIYIVGLLVVIAGSLLVIAYQLKRWLPEIVQMLM